MLIKPPKTPNLLSACNPMEILPQMSRNARENLTTDQVVESVVAGMNPTAELGDPKAQAKAKAMRASQLKAIMEASQSRAHEAFIAKDLPGLVEAVKDAVTTDELLIRAVLRDTFLRAFRLGFTQGNFHASR